MKKAFIGLLILVLSAWAQYVFSAEPIQLARMNPYVAGGASAASCTTANDSELISLGGNTSNYNLYANYIAQPITVTANTQVTEYVVYLRDITATGNTTTCGIYTSSSGAPGTLVVGTQQVSSFSTNAWTWVTFTLSAAVTLSSTAYYVKCHAASTGMVWGIVSGATGSNACTDEDDASWSCTQNTTTGLKVNGCTP